MRLEHENSETGKRQDQGIVVISPSAGTSYMLRIAAANGDQLAAAELLRRQGAGAG